ncbi:MAG: hypothetical protein R3F60_33185 [bacterium]
MKSLRTLLLALSLPTLAAAGEPPIPIGAPDAVQTDPILIAPPAAALAPAEGKASRADNPAAVQTDPVLRQAGDATSSLQAKVGQLQGGWKGRLDRQPGRHPLSADRLKLRQAVGQLKKQKLVGERAAAVSRLATAAAELDAAVDAAGADRALGKVRAALDDLDP